MKLLNIACGARYHKDWINIDFHPHSNLVKKVNLLCNLPFQDNTIDVVYCSHFLEHLTKKQTEFVLREAKRILKKGGVLRIVVPDLENICKEYIRVLDKAYKNEIEHKQYEWITIELLDQLVRMNNGGEMGKIFKSTTSMSDKTLANYILSRTGDDLLNNDSLLENKQRKITWSKIKNKFLYLYLKIVSFLIPKNIRNLIFVNTSIGEKHQWMYDNYSMNIMMSKVGFSNLMSQSYNKSNISNFNDYFLDIKKDSTPYKGISSLYIEGIK